MSYRIIIYNLVARQKEFDFVHHDRTVTVSVHGKVNCSGKSKIVKSCGRDKGATARSTDASIC